MQVVLLEVPAEFREFCGESGNHRYVVIDGQLVVAPLNLATDIVVFHLLGFTPAARRLRDNLAEIRERYGRRVSAAGAFNRAGQFTATRSPLLNVGTPAEMREPILQLIRRQAGHLLV